MLEALQLIIYFILIFSGVLAIAQVKYDGTVLKTYFISAFLLKVLGGLFFAAIYSFYYDGGDTLNYFHNCSIVFEAFVKDPVLAFKIIFSPDRSYQGGLHEFTSRLWYSRDPASFMVVRVSSLINIIGLNSFWTTTFLISTFSYIAVWKFYRALIRVFPKLHKELAVAILFMPSVFFWGSGIMKDTVTLMFLAVLLTSLINMKIGRANFLTWILVIGAFILITITKAYVSACLIPALLLFVVNDFKSKINNANLRTFITPIVLTVTVVGSLFLLTSIEDYLGKFSLDNFDETVESYVWWHSKVVKEIQHGKGSHYSLGQIGGQGLTGLLFKFPLAINVSLFRPYLWEVKNPVMLLTALESLFVLFVTLRVFKRVGLRKYFNLILVNPYVAFTMVYALLFNFAVGIASNNFGALARYKMPGLIMYMIACFLIEYFSKMESVKKR